MNTNGNASIGATGGALVSVSDYANLELSAFGGFVVDPSLISMPAAPTTSGAYYNIQTGVGSMSFDPSTGLASTTSSDYVSQWSAYFMNVIDVNLENGPVASLSSVVQSHGFSAPTVANSAGIAANFGGGQVAAALAVTPPYAPPAYTTLQPGFVSSATTNPPNPGDTIANNPAVYSVGNVGVPNTTSAASLMSASLGNSFSYNFTAGAFMPTNGTASVNPFAVVQLSTPVNPRHHPTASSSRVIRPIRESLFQRSCVPVPDRSR